jgi:hypothetical protein
VDRGLADCPFPATASDPNGPSRIRGPDNEPDPSSRTLTYLTLVLRDDEGLLFEGPASTVHCYRAGGLGPALDVWLPVQDGDDPLPPIRPGSLSVEDPLGTIHARLYRTALGLARAFHVTSRENLDRLAEFYTDQTQGLWVDVGPIGHAARLQFQVAVNSPLPVVRLLVEFYHSGPEDHVCTLDPDGGSARLPPCGPR